MSEVMSEVYDPWDLRVTAGVFGGAQGHCFEYTHRIYSLIVLWASGRHSVLGVLVY